MQRQDNSGCLCMRYSAQTALTPTGSDSGAAVGSETAVGRAAQAVAVARATLLDTASLLSRRKRRRCSC